MSESVSQIYPFDRYAQNQMDKLLHREGIFRDGNLDYSCGIFDEDEQLIATGSCFGNTLRCLAVDSRHQGEGLLNAVVTHLMEVQARRGNAHLFLYTKPETSRFMEDLGFREIARVEGRLVFMENHRYGFFSYCQLQEKKRVEGQRIAGIVMNANPFTRGHQHLVEYAAGENDVVHLFLLSEEAGPIPFAVRRRLVQAGVGHLQNVVYHDSGPYMISFATFPSYFFKDKDEVIQIQAALDLQLFGKIAEILGIQRRYVAQEKNSRVTAMYNEVMKKELPRYGVECVEIPRLTCEGEVISASMVRQAIHDGRLEEIRGFLPETTYEFFAGPEGSAVTAAIQRKKNVIHY